MLLITSFFSYLDAPSSASGIEAGSPILYRPFRFLAALLSRRYARCGHVHPQSRVFASRLVASISDGHFRGAGSDLAFLIFGSPHEFEISTSMFVEPRHTRPGQPLQAGSIWFNSPIVSKPGAGSSSRPPHWPGDQAPPPGTAVEKYGGFHRDQRLSAVPKSFRRHLRAGGRHPLQVSTRRPPTNTRPIGWRPELKSHVA